MKQKKYNYEQDKKITDLLINVFTFVALSCIFGYAGYSFCIDNDYDPQKGMIFGALYSIGIAVIREFDLGGAFTYIVYTIVYFLLVEKIPALVGIIVYFAIIVGFFGYYIYIKTNKNEDNNAKEVKKEKAYNITSPVKIKTNYNKTSPATKTVFLNEEDNYEESIDIDSQEEYHCERCDRIISEEEYIDNCGLCEDCDAEVYFGERYDGDDYDLYR